MTTRTPAAKIIKAPMQANYQRTGYQPSGPTPTTLEFTSYSEESMSAIGSDNPRYPEGLGTTDLTNAFTAWKSGITRVDGTVDFLAKAGTGSTTFYVRKWTLQGGLIKPVLAVPNATAYPSEVDSVAISRLVSSLQKCQHQFLAQVFFGELRQTIAMLRSPAKSLREDLPRYFQQLDRRFKRVTVKGLRKRRETLHEIASGTWLEYVFGWRPLISDIRDALLALKRVGENVESCRLTGIGKKQVQGSVSVSNNKVSSQGWCYGQQADWLEQDFKTVLKGAVTFPVQTPEEAVQKLLGLDWQSTVPALWEITPWSFLLDYFINIGKVLEAAFVAQHSLKYLSKTRITQQNRMVTWSTDKGMVMAGNPSYSILNLQTTPELTRYFRKDVTRVKLDSIPIPPLYVTFQLSPQKWLNIAALLAVRDKQRFSVIGS